MYPILGVIPTHGLFVGLGVLVAAAVFVVEARRRGHTDDRLVYVVLGALMGGAVSIRPSTRRRTTRSGSASSTLWKDVVGGVVAGMLLGLTVGSIVGAGVCTTYSLFVIA